MATPTKTTEVSRDWSALDDTGGVEHIEGPEIDVSGNIATVLHIDVCSADANASTAATSVEVIVFVKSGGADDHWEVLSRLDAAAASTDAGTVGTLTGGSSNSVTYTGTDLGAGQGMFIYEGGGVTNSEIVWLMEGASDAALMDPPVRSHVNTTPYFEVNAQFNVTVPDSVSTCKVAFKNRDADATYLVRVRVTKWTEIG